MRRAKTTVDELIRELQKIRKTGGGDSETLARAEELRRELHTLRRETGREPELRKSCWPRNRNWPRESGLRAQP